MAILTASRATATFPIAGMGGAGNLKVAWGTYELAANPAATDLIRFCRVPKGATVVGGWLMGDDIDTGTEALDIDIGWEANGVDAADTDGFGNMGVLNGATVTNVIPVAGILRFLQGVLLADGPKTFSAETIISGLVNAPANAGGVGTLTLVVLYAVP